MLAGGIGTSLAGRTTLGELAAVLAQCDLVASIMTGSLHVARAVGTPTIALGPAWEAAARMDVAAAGACSPAARTGRATNARLSAGRAFRRSGEGDARLDG